MSIKENKQNKEEKKMTFENLRNMFEHNKNSIIKLNEKYSIQVYDCGKRGNFLINNSPKLHICLKTHIEDIVELIPCIKADGIDGVFVTKKRKQHLINCNIDVLKKEKLISSDFLEALYKYNSKY